MCNVGEKDGSTTSEEPEFHVQEAPAPQLNPFVHHWEFNSTYDRCKLVLMSVFVVPLKVCGIVLCLCGAYILACIGLYGLSREELSQYPLTGWRSVLKEQVRLLVRTIFFIGGFHLVHTKGQQAHSKQAPILVVAPHSSFFDSVPVVCMGAPSVVAKADLKKIPFFTKYIDYTQPVYVWREDPSSRQNTIKEIQRRATSTEDWPQILIFPEGTCTNRSCLITFKCGGFYPGVPVQPVLIRYPNRTDCFTWTWDGPGVLRSIWVAMCQFHNYCEIEFLPVYLPSEMEKQDANLFARNVRQVMADALGLPVTDYSYDDCRLMEKARLKNLPVQTGLIEFQALRQRLGLDLKNVEEELMNKYAHIATSNGKITLQDFAKYLSIPETEPALIELFNLYDQDKSGKIDFREYLIGYCQFTRPANNEKTLQWAFKLFDHEGKGLITKDDLVNVLRASFDMTSAEATRMFKQIDTTDKGYITYEDFVLQAKLRPEYAKIFLHIQESVKLGVRACQANSLPGKAKVE